MRTLDIAFVTETYPPEVNGVAMTVGRLVGGLRELGHRVSVIRPRQGKADTGNEHEMALSGLPLPGYPGLKTRPPRCFPAALSLTRARSTRAAAPSVASESGLKTKHPTPPGAAATQPSSA